MTAQVFLTAMAMVCSVPVLMLGIVVFGKKRSTQALSQSSEQTEEILRRLERIEQAIDATAIEVERFSESNRFVVKLLSERPQGPRPDEGGPAKPPPYPSRSG